MNIFSLNPSRDFRLSSQYRQHNEQVSKALIRHPSAFAPDLYMLPPSGGPNSRRGCTRPPRDFDVPPSTSLREKFIFLANGLLDRLYKMNCYDWYDFRISEPFKRTFPEQWCQNLISPNKSVRVRQFQTILQTQVENSWRDPTPLDWSSTVQEGPLCWVQSEALLRIYTDVDLSGWYYRKFVHKAEYKETFKQLFRLTIGTPASEEFAIKKLQEACDLLNFDSFRRRFEAPLLASFHGTNGGSIEEFLFQRNILKRFVLGHGTTVAFLLECISEPGFFQKIYPPRNKCFIFFDNVWSKIVAVGNLFKRKANDFSFKFSEGFSKSRINVVDSIFRACPPNSISFWR